MAVDVVPTRDLTTGALEDMMVGDTTTCGKEQAAMRGWAVVTGASGGIGTVLTRRLAEEGYPVIMACRNLGKAWSVQHRVTELGGNQRVIPYELDLASLESVRCFVERLRAEKKQVALLLNNAGVMNGNFRLTKDGLEEDIAVNCVSAAALALGLLPLMGAGSQIVNTVSCTYRIGRIDKGLLQPDPRHFGRFFSYGSSKLALLLFTLELASRVSRDGVRVNAADPGVVNTGMLTMGRWFDPLTDKLFRPLVKTPQQGAETALSLALSPLAAQVTGELWRGGRSRRIPRSVYEHPLRGWLWNEIVQLLEKHNVVPHHSIPTRGMGKEEEKFQ